MPADVYYLAVNGPNQSQWGGIGWLALVVFCLMALVLAKKG